MSKEASRGLTGTTEKRGTLNFFTGGHKIREAVPGAALGEDKIRVRGGVGSWFLVRIF